MYRLKRTRYYLYSLLAGALFFLATGAPACGGGNKATGQKSETDIQQSNYDKVSKSQPAHTMPYSPTRDTVNFWIDTWKKPGKLSYVYLQAANGELIGYYIFKGLPVSYCVSLTPNYTFVDPKDDDVNQAYQVPAPSIDSVYYSGGQCNSYYGRDATTNSYIEYTVGNGQNVLLYERALPRQDVKPLGFTTIAQVKK
jgi:hypothetical protein